MNSNGLTHDKRGWYPGIRVDRKSVFLRSESLHAFGERDYKRLLILRPPIFPGLLFRFFLLATFMLTVSWCAGSVSELTETSTSIRNWDADIWTIRSCLKRRQRLLNRKFYPYWWGWRLALDQQIHSQRVQFSCIPPVFFYFSFQFCFLHSTLPLSSRWSQSVWRAFDDRPCPYVLKYTAWIQCFRWCWFSKGENAVRIHRELLKIRRMKDLHFRGGGYYVSTVGLDEDGIR